MTDYTSMKLPVLVDLLAEQTAEYTQIMSEGLKNGAEFSHMEQKIISLQEAIHAKQSFDTNRTSTDEVIFTE